MKLAIRIAMLGVSMAVGFSQSATDLLTQYRKDLEAHRNSSLAHLRIGEILSQQGNYQAAANEFREALSGDLQPRWTEVWAHIYMGRIYDATGQRDRAVREHQLAFQTGDNTQDAITEATEYLRSQGVTPTVPVSFVQSQARTAPSELLSRTDPEYSDEARLAELEGTVVVAGSVGEDGRAKDLSVAQTLGLGLDEKAIEAVQQWRFQPDTKSISVPVEFSLPSKQSRWHLIGVDFHPPEGASRPHVLTPNFPGGAGVFSGSTIEEGRLLGGIGRQAFITLSFDVNEGGMPVNIRVMRSSDPVWDDDATTVLRYWRFTPGMKDGKAISVPCSFDFVWGPRNLSSKDVGRLLSVLHPPPAPSDYGTTPVAIFSPVPPYWDQARDAGLEGTVLVSLTVGADGAPRNVRVMKGLDPAIDESVIATLGQWRFKTTLLNGEVSSPSVVVQVKFQLPDSVVAQVLEPPRRVPVAPVRVAPKQ
jgi:TonB family protein